jgi:hypothetical protein
VRGAYRGNFAFLSSRASSSPLLSNWADDRAARPTGGRRLAVTAMARARGIFLLDYVHVMFYIDILNKTQTRAISAFHSDLRC